MASETAAKALSAFVFAIIAEFYSAMSAVAATCAKECASIAEAAMRSVCSRHDVRFLATLFA